LLIGSRLSFYSWKLITISTLIELSENNNLPNTEPITLSK